MPWSGPRSDRCQLKELSPRPEVEFPEDEQSQYIDIARDGYLLIGRRPRQAIAGEQEHLDEADRMDKSADEMDKFREKYGGYHSDPGFGNDF